MTTEWHLSGSWVHYELALSRHMFMLFFISGISCLGFVWLIFSPLPLSVTSSLQMSLHLKLISGFCQVDFLSQWAEWFISKYYYLLLITSMVEKNAMTYIWIQASQCQWAHKVILLRCVLSEPSRLASALSQNRSLDMQLIVLDCELS
jgi:hypothetical protein